MTERVSDETLQGWARNPCPTDPVRSAARELLTARARIATLETLTDAMRTALDEQPGEPQLLAFLRKLPPSWIEAPNIDAEHALRILSADLDRARARIEKLSGYVEAGDARIAELKAAHQDVVENWLPRTITEPMVAELDRARAVVEAARKDHALCDGVIVSLDYDTAPAVLPGTKRRPCPTCAALAAYDTGKPTLEWKRGDTITIDHKTGAVEVVPDDTGKGET